MNNSQLCPHCGNHLNIHVSKSQSSSRFSPLVNTFANGGNNVPIMPYKLHKKPIYEIQPNHFVLSGIVGALAATLVLITTSTFCYLGVNCLSTTQVLLSAILAGLGSSAITLKFIDSGRYEIKEETAPIQKQMASFTPPSSPSQLDARCIEIKTIKPSGRIHLKWFNLPSGIDDDTIKHVAQALQLDGASFSRPYLCSVVKVISQHKYRMLHATLKEQGLIDVTSNNKTIVNGAGRAFFRDFLPPISVD